MDGARPTTAGLAIIAKALTGKSLTFTRGAFGNSTRAGAVINPTLDEQAALTKLIGEQMTLPIAAVSADGGNAVVKLLVKNADVTETFRIREVGLYAKDPDSNAELLYCYYNFGDKGPWMPAKNGPFAVEYFFTLVTAVGPAENVTAIIDFSKLMVTFEQLTDHINSANPHPNLQIEHYELPTASTSTKGGVKIGSGLRISNAVLSVDPNILNSKIPVICIPNFTWRGTSDSASGSVALDTSPANSNNLNLSGDYLLNSNGFFTLQ